MSFLSIDKVSPATKDSDIRTAEVNFDGRTIGTIVIQGDGPGRLELADAANPEDIREAGTIATTEGKACSLQAYISELFLVTLARENSMRRMRIRLKKNTLFATPGSKVQMIASPYCERIRSHIKKTYPEAVILNTLSEDEAFKHFHPNP